MSPPTQVVPEIQLEINTFSKEKIGILQKVYANEELIIVIDEFGEGKSGAKTYLLKIGRSGTRYEIAKFDHPHALRPEAQNFLNYAKKSLPRNFRTAVANKFEVIDGQSQVVIQTTEKDDNFEGLLHFTFEGDHHKGKVLTLLKYYDIENGENVAQILTELFSTLAVSWYDTKGVQEFSLAHIYDRLLPVHFEVIREDVRATNNVLQSGKIDYLDTAKYSKDDIVRLEGFQITSIREDIRLHGTTSRASAPNLRVKLKDEKIWASASPLHWGEKSDHFMGRISKTRKDLFYEYANSAELDFKLERGTDHFIIDKVKYPNPLPALEYKNLSNVPPQRMSTSIVHNDLNLNNILVNKDQPILIDFANTKSDQPVLIDFQRLEDHVIAEILAPEMQKCHLDANVLVDILNSLHRNDTFSIDIEEIISSRPYSDQLRKPYYLLITIRKLAKEHLYPTNNWAQYYKGLFLVFAGALKYSRNAYQKRLLLVGMATVDALSRLNLDEQYIPDRLGKGITMDNRTKPSDSLNKNPIEALPKPTSNIDKSFWKKQMPIILGLLIGAIFMGLIALRFKEQLPTVPGISPPTATNTPTAEPTPTATLLPTSTPMPSPTPTLALSQNWPPVNGSMMARINERGYLKCGIAGDLLGFSSSSPTEGGIPFLDSVDQSDYSNEIYLYTIHATGFDADFCKALAAAIFGDSENRVIFLNLAAANEQSSSKPERFDALLDGIVDVLSRNSTQTMGRELEYEAGPTMILDGAKIMLEKTISNTQVLESLNTFSETVAYIKEEEIRVCVAQGTTTLAVLNSILPSKQVITENETKFSTNKEAFADYTLTDNCSAIASDESQLRSRISENPSRFPNEAIVPIDEYLSFEPLAPFVLNNDAEWADFVRLVAWSLMRAEQLKITKHDAELYLAAYGDSERNTIIGKISDETGILRIEYDKFFNFPVTKFNETGVSYSQVFTETLMLNIIAETGNYQELFDNNIAQILDDSESAEVFRSINKVYNPLYPTKQDNRGRLLVPTLGW